MKDVEMSARDTEVEAAIAIEKGIGRGIAIRIEIATGIDVSYDQFSYNNFHFLVLV